MGAPERSFRRGEDGYGVGTHAISDGEMLAVAPAERLREEITARFRDPAYKPPLFPTMALEIHRLVEDPDVDAPKIVKLLEKDPVLAAQVLRVARSAAYASIAGTITSLLHAVTRLGLRMLTQVVWEAAFNNKVFRSPQYANQVEQVRRHSAACAHLARMVARSTALPSDYAFLCGLMHDIGMVASLMVLGEDRRRPPIDEALLAPALRDSHEESGAIVAKLWNLPGDVQLVVAHHHQLRIQGHVHPLAAIVCLADGLATEHGRGVTMAGQPFEAPDDAQKALAATALNLTDKQLQTMRAEAQKLLATLAAGAV